jgi:hypothetical protein
MLETEKGGSDKSHNEHHGRSPNQTGWFCIRIHGSIGPTLVPGEVEHLCPCFFHLTQLKQIHFANKSINVSLM